MRRLPPIPLVQTEMKLGGSELILPCPAIDLIRLATSAGRDRRTFKQLLRHNPALLIFALATHFSVANQAPESFKQLISWCESNLLGYFENQPEGWSEFPVNIQDCSGRFGETLPLLRRARSNKQVRKSLTWMLCTIAAWKQKAAKKWVDRMVGRKFEVKRSKTSQSRCFFNEYGDNPLADSLDVESVFQFRLCCERIQSDFQHRLLVEKMEAMKQLAYGASHEINNPLANIATRAQTLLGEDTDPERRHKLAMIYEQAMRAHEMISDLMLFANPPAIEPVSTDVRLWISKIIKEIKPSLERIAVRGPAIQQPAIDLEIRISSDVRRVEMDSSHLSVALKALVQNSIESIGSSANTGKIAVRVYFDQDSYLVIEVIDDGIGVAESAKPHLFDPFYSGREAGRGLGFGLSKAWRIAELHGGSLRFDQEYSAGARFFLRIPQSHPVIVPMNDASVA